MPTKRQKQQASLRETAALNGLFVEFRDLPLAPARLARMPAADRQVLYYGCRLRPSKSAPTTRLAWYLEDGEWTPVQGRERAPELVSGLPEGILAVESGRASCGIYWREQGDENVVLSIAETLTRWRDDLSPPRGTAP